MFIHHLNEHNGEAHKLSNDTMEKWTQDSVLRTTFPCWLVRFDVRHAIRHADDAPIDDFYSPRSDIKLRLYTVHMRPIATIGPNMQIEFIHIALGCFERIRTLVKDDCMRLHWALFILFYRID